MAVSKELLDFYKYFHSELAPPHLSKLIKEATAKHKENFNPSAAIQVDSRFPDFELENQNGSPVSLNSLLTFGLILITFYRSQVTTTFYFHPIQSFSLSLVVNLHKKWCPFRNIALNDLQKELPAFRDAGVQLIAITPELPDTSLSTIQKNNLEFTVFSDVDNSLASQLGILFVEPLNYSEVFEHIGFDYQQAYGPEAAKRGLDVPIPAKFLLDRKCIVKQRFIELNFHVRLEPKVALEWIKTLN